MVTCWVDRDPWGLTVTACCSVSVEPPLLLVSLGRETLSATTIARTGLFGVSLLGETSVGTARFGSAPGQPKFVHDFCLSHEHASERSRTPVVAHALAHVDCALDRTIEAGDHVLHIGRVESVLIQAEDRPLLYYHRTYHRLGSWADLQDHPATEETIDSLAYDYPVPLRFTLPAPAVSEREGVLRDEASGER